MAYHVYYQQDGRDPELRGEFDTREQALALIAEMGGLMDEPIFVQGDGPEDDDTETYNLGHELNCPIAFITAY